MTSKLPVQVDAAISIVNIPEFKLIAVTHDVSMFVADVTSKGVFPSASVNRDRILLVMSRLVLLVSRLIEFPAINVGAVFGAELPPLPPFEEDDEPVDAASKVLAVFSKRLDTLSPVFTMAEIAKTATSPTIRA